MTKKGFLLTAILTLALSLIGTHNLSQAAGGVYLPHAKLSADSTSTVADGSSTITVTARFYLYECNDEYDGHRPHADTVSGCDAYGGVRGEVPYELPCPYHETVTTTVGVSGDGITLSKSNICGGSEGVDTFTVKSSTAGSKTLTPTTTWSYSPTKIEGTAITLNFTAPPAATPTPAPTKKKTTTATQPAPTKPQAPTVTNLTADSETKDLTAADLSFEEEKPIVLSGKTVANGKVTLYVFSEPKQYTAAADKDGNWSVSVEDLPVGKHHAEIEVTDPATNLTSDRAKLMEFSVVAAQKPVPTVAQVTPVKEKSSKAGLWVGLGVVVALLAASGGFISWKRKRAGKAGTGSSDQQPPTPTVFTPPTTTPTV